MLEGQLRLSQLQRVRSRAVIPSCVILSEAKDPLKTRGKVSRKGILRFAQDDTRHRPVIHFLWPLRATRAAAGALRPARLLLDGDFRVIEDGVESFESGHPPFDHLTDVAIADILHYMLSGESGDEPMRGPGYTAAEVEVLRAQ